MWLSWMKAAFLFLQIGEQGTTKSHSSIEKKYSRLLKAVTNTDI